MINFFKGLVDFRITSHLLTVHINARAGLESARSPAPEPTLMIKPFRQATE